MEDSTKFKIIVVFIILGTVFGLVLGIASIFDYGIGIGIGIGIATIWIGFGISAIFTAIKWAWRTVQKIRLWWIIQFLMLISDIMANILIFLLAFIVTPFMLIVFLFISPIITIYRLIYYKDTDEIWYPLSFYD